MNGHGDMAQSSSRDTMSFLDESFLDEHFIDDGSSGESENETGQVSRSELRVRLTSVLRTTGKHFPLALESFLKCHFFLCYQNLCIASEYLFL